MKSCKYFKCQQINPQSLDQFYKQNTTSDGLDSWCKSCKKSYIAEYRIQNLDHILEYREKTKEHKKQYDKVYQESKKDKFKLYNRESHLRRKYKLTIEQYNKMVEDQLGHCLICRKHMSSFKNLLCVDHCHKTNKIRGLLCDKCNNLLGRAEDSIDILSSAIEYLRQYGKTE